MKRAFSNLEIKLFGEDENAWRGVSGIYCIENIANGKRYIGSAVSIKQRWNEHRSMLRRGSHHSKHLQNAYNKYGEASFAFHVYAVCAKESLIALEQDLMDMFRPEYNSVLTAGNTLGRKHSAETKSKIAEKAIGRKCSPRSASYRLAISRAHKGKPKASWHIAALQEGRKKQVYTSERRQKIGDSLREAYSSGRKSRDRPTEYRAKIGRTVGAFTDDDVVAIRAMRDAGATYKRIAEKYDSNPASVCNLCNRKTYKWVA